MLIKTPDKAKAFTAVINIWLKDKTIYCNECGKTYTSYVNECVDPMCGGFQIGTNFDHCRGVIKQNKELAKTRLNDFGSNHDKNIRWGLSLPPSLFNVLDNFKKVHNQPGLFKEDGEIVWFMKKFPQFRVCTRT